MKPEYQTWIENNVEGDGYGDCKEATEEMVKAFPELKRVRGHYYCFAWGERTHWWCVEADGTIVDPTCQQFPSKGKGVYEPWIEGTKEPTGMCPNCGGMCYDHRDCCSDKCYREYAAYCNSPL